MKSTEALQVSFVKSILFQNSLWDMKVGVQTRIKIELMPKLEYWMKIKWEPHCDSREISDKEIWLQTDLLLCFLTLQNADFVYCLWRIKGAVEYLLLFDNEVKKGPGKLSCSGMAPVFTLFILQKTLSTKKSNFYMEQSTGKLEELQNNNDKCDYMPMTPVQLVLPLLPNNSPMILTTTKTQTSTLYDTFHSHAQREICQH